MRRENPSVRRRAGMLALVIGLVVASPALVGAATSPTKQIRSNWIAFFSSKTPPAKKIALLQNGKKFATVIRQQAKSPLNKDVTAKVLKVTLKSKTTAAVRYTILIEKAPALKNQPGTAVLQDKTWKVSAASFCALLALEGTRPAPCPVPAAEQIKKNWIAFFSSKTSPTKKIALLQNGKKFATVIRQQAKSSLNKDVTAKVLKVTLKSKTTAAVRYTILINKSPALKDKTGTAVLQDKTWKVSDSAFCTLLAHEGQKPAACPKG